MYGIERYTVVYNKWKLHTFDSLLFLRSFSKPFFQRRTVLYWKYSLNTPIFSKSLKSNSVPLNKNVYHLWNSHNISLYKCRGCCKPIFSKGYTGSQVDVINIAASPLWIQLIPFSQCKPRVPMAHFGSIFFLAKFPDNIYSICILWPNLRCETDSCIYWIDE